MAGELEHYDVVVVGAGVWGLCAAHTFLAINPALSVLIVEDKTSVGGVWASEQLYPGLRANNLQGYYEFSDFPMLDAGLGVKQRGLLHGETINKYLRKYAEHFDLLRRTRLNTRVIRATETTEGDEQKSWLLELSSDGSGDVQSSSSSSSITCAKLVIATGQATTPIKPSFEGQSTFTKPLIHSADLGKVAPSLIADEKVKEVAVIGGSKSAHDAVYMFAMAGKHVTWLTHKNGRGAMPMALPYTQMGPWRVWLEGLLMLRPLSWFGMAPWSTGDGFGWVRWLLHETKMGRKMVEGFFANMSAGGPIQSGLLDNEKTKILEPDASLMWYGTQASSLNYDTDFYALIRDGKVEAMRTDISHLSAGAVHLGSGEQIATDALVAAIGYDYTSAVPLFPSDKRVAWGCPVPATIDDGLHSSLELRADEELLNRFPALRTAPTPPERLPTGMTPWRLFRFIAPPSQVAQPAAKRNLAFLNAITSYQTTIKAELTSLWAWAYLHDELPGLQAKGVTEDEARYEATLWSRFGKWRAPYGMQGRQADFLYDSMPYYDLLLRDLGCRSWRKGWGIFGEIFGSWYTVSDYRGVIGEWMKACHELTKQRKAL